MLNYPNNYFLQSAPFRISWAGFESDTLKLQNNGWSVAVEDVCDHAFCTHEVRFILKHEMLNLYAITRVNTFEFSDLTDYLFKHKDHLKFHIQVIGKDIHYQYLPQFSFDSIKEIDCHPQFESIERHSIKDLSIFKTLVTPESALIIEPERIADLLEKIVEAQVPNQKEIRERMRSKDRRDMLKQTLHAQILSVAC
jgi:hypothetical protein